MNHTLLSSPSVLYMVEVVSHHLQQKEITRSQLLMTYFSKNIHWIYDKILLRFFYIYSVETPHSPNQKGFLGGSAWMMRLTTSSIFSSNNPSTLRSSTALI